MAVLTWGSVSVRTMCNSDSRNVVWCGEWTCIVKTRMFDVRTIQYCRHNTVKMMSTEQHVDAPKSKNNTIIKTIRSDVFVALKQLTNDTKSVRVKGAFDLVQQLQKKSNSNDENTVSVNVNVHLNVHLVEDSSTHHLCVGVRLCNRFRWIRIVRTVCSVWFVV